MPELPEVEVVRRGLRARLPGRTIVGFRYSGKKLRLPVPSAQITSLLTGASVTDVSRRAKYLLIHFDNGAVLIVHLGMTGKLGIFKTGSEPGHHDHLGFALDNGRELRFNDVRRFGSIQIVDAERVSTIEQSVFKTAGPEPFSDAFNGRYLHAQAGNRIQSVKTYIMDSRTVAGVGNIYANESLFSAGINPARKAGAISLKRYCRLVEEIRNVLSRAIDYGGSTISDFIGASGQSGYFQVHFSVYGKKGVPCPNCSTPIRHRKLGGRASFFCPACQR